MPDNNNSNNCSSYCKLALSLPLYSVFKNLPFLYEWWREFSGSALLFITITIKIWLPFVFAFQLCVYTSSNGVVVISAALLTSSTHFHQLLFSHSSPWYYSLSKPERKPHQAPLSLYLTASVSPYTLRCSLQPATSSTHISAG